VLAGQLAAEQQVEDVAPRAGRSRRLAVACQPPRQVTAAQIARVGGKVRRSAEEHCHLPGLHGAAGIPLTPPKQPTLTRSSRRSVADNCSVLCNVRPQAVGRIRRQPQCAAAPVDRRIAAPPYAPYAAVSRASTASDTSK